MVSLLFKFKNKIYESSKEKLPPVLVRVSKQFLVSFFMKQFYSPSNTTYKLFKNPNSSIPVS